MTLRSHRREYIDILYYIYSTQSTHHLLKLSFYFDKHVFILKGDSICLHPINGVGAHIEFPVGFLSFLENFAFMTIGGLLGDIFQIA